MTKRIACAYSVHNAAKKSAKGLLRGKSKFDAVPLQWPSTLALAYFALAQNPSNCHKESSAPPQLRHSVTFVHWPRGRRVLCDVSLGISKPPVSMTRSNILNLHIQNVFRSLNTSNIFQPLRSKECHAKCEARSETPSAANT